MTGNPLATMRSARATIRTFLAIIFFFAPPAVLSQSLSVKWEELTSADFVKAIQQSQGTCLLPVGIMEKHGLHLPLGNDLININVRYASLHAAEQDYTLVFPEYYVSQIFEARHQPGTVAYSARLQFDLLQETTDEMGRKRLQESHHRERPWRERTSAAVLCAGSAGVATRLHRLRL